MRITKLASRYTNESSFSLTRSLLGTVMLMMRFLYGGSGYESKDYAINTGATFESREDVGRACADGTRAHLKIREHAELARKLEEVRAKSGRQFLLERSLFAESFRRSRGLDDVYTHYPLLYVVLGRS